jgi:nitrate/TMAO reductase-like tetraheme cytochrome c subunit
MNFLDQGLTAFTLVGVALILLIVLRPGLTAARGGKVLAFLALFIFPVLAIWLGTSSHIEHSKSTSFCLSCHEMQPYGESLRIDDGDYLPAGHYQNNRVPREDACFTCHTTYTMFGDIQAKLTGLRHVYVHYLGNIPEKIELYSPYSNRECLHCHDGARSFEESQDHIDMRAELASGETSCLDCHAFVHDVTELGNLEMWQGVGKETE